MEKEKNMIRGVERYLKENIYNYKIRGKEYHNDKLEYEG